MSKKITSSNKNASKATKKSVVKKIVKAPAKKTITKKAVKPTSARSKGAAKKIAPSKSLKLTKKQAPKKIDSNKAAVKKSPVTKSAVAKSAVAKKTSSKKPIVKPAEQSRGVLRQTFVTKPKKNKDLKLSPFFAKQRVRLLQLKDTLLDSIQGVSRDNLHAGSDTSAFGMHQADAGSDAYDRDFALSILSQEQNSLYEIDEALKRIDDGAYGVCEVCNKAIPHARLEARPFTRFTVDCQAELEKRQHFSGARLPVSSLFGLTEEETENEDEENIIENTKD